MPDRRQDARDKRRRAAALNQLDQGVQVHPRVTRDLLGQLEVEARAQQSLQPPADPAGRCPAGTDLLSTMQVHISLAHPHESFLLASGKTSAGGSCQLAAETVAQPAAPGSQ